jgi:hypothetical protein
MNKKRKANENETIRKKRRATIIIIISENLRNRSAALMPSVRLEMKERKTCEKQRTGLFQLFEKWQELSGKKKVDRRHIEETFD